MMEGTRGWTHKGELIFLLSPFILFLSPFHFDGRRIIGDDVSHCLYAYIRLLMIVQVSGSLWLFHTSS
jgi:hypothetical protein